ncbi:MAG: PP2C family protein-serine/threonine phosphatase [Candidatus Aquicultorales bacterium]
MPNDPFKKLSPLMQRYAVFVSFLGFIATVAALAVGDWSSPPLVVFVAAVATALVLELMPIEEIFPHVLGEVTLTDAIHLATIALFGHGFAVTAGVASCLIAEIVRKRVWYKGLFNVAAYAITISSAALAFILVSSADPEWVFTLPLSFGAAFLVYRVAGSLIMGGIFSIRQGVPFRDAFVDQFKDEGILYLSQGIISLSGIYLYLGNPLFAIGMIVPLLGLSHANERARRYRVESHVIGEELVKGGEMLNQFLPPAAAVSDLDIAYRLVPHTTLSGDFFDLLEVDGEIYISIGDAMGKGTQATIAGSPPRHALHFWAQHFNTAEILKQLNGMLYGRLPEEAFVSMFCARLSPETGKLRWTNAGHPPPICVNTASRDHVLLSGGNIMLGASGEADYEENSISFGKDDILVLYTDGVTETLGSGRSQYGMNRLLEVVKENCEAPAESLVEAIYSSVSRFSRGYRHDDLTILVVKGEKSASLAVASDECGLADLRSSHS